jgi:nucleoside-diphosphate-sugar epimerase
VALAIYGTHFVLALACSALAHAKSCGDGQSIQWSWPMSARVLIAGCGYVGTALGRALAGTGHEVWGLSRNPDVLPRELRAVGVDLTNPASYGGLPREFEYVVYSASADTSSDAAYERAYVLGTRHLIRHLTPRSVQRMFFISSTAVYAQEDGCWVDEASPTEPQQFSGQRTLEGEAEVRSAAFPTTILRCSGIYGPGRDRLVNAVRSGEPMSYPERFGNRIHRDDIVGSVLHLIASASEESLLLLSDDEPAPQRAVVEFVATELGVAPPPALAGGVPAARGGNKRCCNARLKASGYRLRFPTYREGYAALAASAALAS